MSTACGLPARRRTRAARRFVALALEFASLALVALAIATPARAADPFAAPVEPVVFGRG